jgi:YcaO-like protein with predicted kinase domain
MLIRSFLKARSAETLNSLSADDLFNRFQITRVGELTGLDHIGVPVWAATRPCAKVISVTAGKSLDSKMARAGAIAESIEYATFENPRGEFQIEDWTGFDPRVWWVAKGASWEQSSNIPVEHITHYGTKKEILFPSDLIWLGDRVPKPALFQRTSNGQSVAGTFEEAFLSGLYECVERDAISIRTCAMQEFSRIPPKHDLTNLEGGLANICARIEQAGLILFLFHCSFDIPIPVYWAIVIDKDGLPPFAGWGCHITSQVAAERAILEAIQSRLVYISGARDDIQRRNFDLLRNQDPTELIRIYSDLPATDTFTTQAMDFYPNTEIALVLTKLGAWTQQILYKHILLPFGLHAVKVFVIGLESPITPMWQPGRWNEIRDTYFCGAEPVRSPDCSEAGRTMVTPGGPG